ncbi:GBF-interacting protein 1-like isoform X2 [Punica granatum]|uniref:GBF-interacting protein 1-like isoform X2 n=2 Tax=Punica granatum TaxID=22663 RepID=A0A6P8BWT3_PUNGR|nr:GBF-interacting protein 1-like isoform X2 [Punica granatum]
MSSSGGGARVSIPDNVRKTIQNIREISGKQHTDEDVYAMLKDCAMDPNETAQKLLYLDTFHEVKSKRDKRKETTNSKVPDSKLTLDQGRGARGNRNPSVSHASSGGPKNPPYQREKRTSNFTERGSGPAPLPQQKTKDNAGTHVTKAPVVVANGPSNLSNGISTYAPTPESSVDDIVIVSEASASGVSSAWDPVIAPPLPRQSSAGPVKREIGLKRMPSANSVYKKKVTNKSEATEKDQGSQPPQPSFTVNEDQSLTTDPSSGKVDGPVEEASISLEVITSKVASVKVESGSQSLPTSTVTDSQHVTFPNHFQVSEAFKNGLTFGSFDANFGARTEVVTDPVGNDKSNFVAESSQESDENVEESSPRNHLIVDIGDHPQPSSLGHEEVPPSSEEKVLGSGDFTHGEPKQDTLLPPEGPPNPVVQDGPSNSFGFIPPMLANPNVVHSEGSEPQARDISRPSYFVNGNGPVLSSPSPTPTPAAQSSMSVSPQPIPVFRQPYPLNYFPYGHYLTPVYMPPIHQLLSHNAFAQQPSAGNLYLPPTMSAPGVKLPFPMFKPGTNTATPIGIPSGYGGYGSTSMGYTASAAVTSGTSASNEDLAASQLKENHIYSTAQLSEGPAVWIPPLGQDLTSLQVNSLYNLPQGQHVTFSPAQAGHGAFGMQQPPQTMAGAPTAHPLLQQSQGGTVETVGLPSGAYQLPQHAQINWNANF